MATGMWLINYGLAISYGNRLASFYMLPW